MSCQRFESEGLTGFPITPELRAHVDTCAECQQAEAAFGKLEQLLHVAGDHAAPPAGWEARLTQRMSQRRFPLRSVVLIASAVAAALVAFVLLPRRAGPMQPTATELIAASGMRAVGASVGSTWKVSVDARQELRVWRQGALVLRCGVDGPCQNAGSRTIANVLLSAPGEYRAMVITPGSAPLRDPVGFDEDARLAKEAGAAYDIIEPIVVY